MKFTSSETAIAFTPTRFLLFFILISFLAFSCHTTKEIKLANNDLATKYNESLKTWEKQKRKNNDSYEFSISYASWVGYSNLTTFTVKKGKVVARVFSATERSEDGQYGELKQVFAENESNINANESGPRAITIDAIYQESATKFLTKDEEWNNISFDVDKLGIVKHTGFFPKNCADDCFTGYTINSFKWL